MTRIFRGLKFSRVENRYLFWTTKCSMGFLVVLSCCGCFFSDIYARTVVLVPQSVDKVNAKSFSISVELESDSSACGEGVFVIVKFPEVSRNLNFKLLSVDVSGKNYLDNSFARQNGVRYLPPNYEANLCVEKTLLSEMEIFVGYGGGGPATYLLRLSDLNQWR